jgi:hypothetical protein
MQEILTPRSASGATGRHPLGLLGLAVALIVVAGLTFGTLRLTGVLGGQTVAEQQAAALTRTQDEMRPQVEALMAARGGFFAAERRYLPAMASAHKAVMGYNRKLARVEAEVDAINAANAARMRACGSRCPQLDYPAYPKRPKLGPELRDLQAVVLRTGELHGQLSGQSGGNAQSGGNGMTMAYSDLLSAVDLLGRDAQDNLLSLTAMRKQPKTKGLYADGSARLPIRTLNGNSSLPAVRRMNANLVRLLRKVDLPMGTYDLPGGRDLSRDDHSTSV